MHGNCPFAVLYRVVGQIRYDVSKLGRIDRRQNPALRRDVEVTIRMRVGDGRDQIGDEGSDVDWRCGLRSLHALPALQED
jgi:hypothetical protein